MASEAVGVEVKNEREPKENRACSRPRGISNLGVTQTADETHQLPTKLERCGATCQGLRLWEEGWPEQSEINREGSLVHLP